MDEVVEMKHNREVLRKAAIQKLTDRILQGQLPPGTRLASEREMAREMQISRGSLNQAILELERMGFLDVRPRQGVFVADYLEHPTPHTMQAIMDFDPHLLDVKLYSDLMEMRSLIEQKSTAMAIQNLQNEESLQKLADLARQMSKVDLDHLPRVILDFHYELVRAGGNRAYALLYKSFDSMLYALISMRCSQNLDRQKSDDHHLRLSQALQERNGQQAEQLINDILCEANRNMLDHYQQRDSERAQRP